MIVNIRLAIFIDISCYLLGPLVIGQCRENRLIDKGRVGSGISTKTLGDFLSLLRPLVERNGDSVNIANRRLDRCMVCCCLGYLIEELSDEKAILVHYLCLYNGMRNFPSETYVAGTNSLKL